MKKYAGSMRRAYSDNLSQYYLNEYCVYSNDNTNVMCLVSNVLCRVS